MTGNIIRLDNKHLVFSVEYSEKTLTFAEDNGSHTLIDLKENGTIEAEKKSNKELKEIGIAAERSDEIIIQWDMVKCIDSVGNKRFVLSDQQSFIGSAKCVDVGMVKISDGIVRETIPIPLSSIVSINPPPPPSEITFRTIFNAGGSLQTGNTDAVEGHFQPFLELSQNVTNSRLLQSIIMEKLMRILIQAMHRAIFTIHSS